MQQTFGDYIDRVKDEMNCFMSQEKHLEALLKVYDGLCLAVNVKIQTGLDSSNNMIEIAKSFEKVREMKGSENSQVMNTIQNISTPFNNSAEAE